MSPETIRTLALTGSVLGFGAAAIAAFLVISSPGGSGLVANGRFQAVERPIAEFSFTDGAGKPEQLADFTGKVVLLNLWATWCPPCVREMPSLNRLQVELGGSEFVVLAVAEDRGGAAVVLPFLEKNRLQALSPHLDPSGAAVRAFGLRGLPSSVLIGRDGREVARLLGGTDWDDSAVRRQITDEVGKK